MKFQLVGGFPRQVESLPTRGGWIEIPALLGLWQSSGSLPTRGGWIEINFGLKEFMQHNPSLPTRGGWIEMGTPSETMLMTDVPPHTGRVD